MILALHAGALLRRGARWLPRALLLAALVGVGAEGLLQLGSVLARDRGGDRRPDAALRILSVGDSHTFGTNVGDEESYPAQLQRLLDEALPGRFSVINLGIPGMSSTQVRRRLASNVARYEPDLVIAWCGVNDYWNVSEGDAPAAWSERLDALALRSRLYRLIRVWQHDRAIGASEDALRAGGLHQRLEIPKGARLGSAPNVTVTLHHGGRAEAIRTEEGTLEEGLDHRERSYRELRAMAEWLRAARVGLILVRYPVDGTPPFEAPNRAMEQVAREFSLPIVDTSASIARIPVREQEWKWAMHPSGPMYQEIARDLVPLVLRAGEDS